MDQFTLEKIEFDEIRRILRRYCSCSLGRDMCAHINPSAKADVIHRWQSQTAEMVLALRDFGPPPFGGISDISESLEKIQPGRGGTGEDFADIAACLKGTAELKRYLLPLPEEHEQLHSLAESIASFETQIGAIEEIVAPDGSIFDHASDRLSRTRREMTTTADEIHRAIHSYVQNPDVAKLLQSQNVTLHGDRYVLPVKVENRGRLKGVVHRSSNTGATVFVEPNASVELNNRLADLAEDERREVQRLLNQLGVRVYARAEDIRNTLRTVARIDLISAKAQYAYQFEMTRPRIDQAGPLDLHRARHPLLVEQAHQQDRAGIDPENIHPVVPIDVRLGSDFDLLIITGSNTGGKTVTLKTVALLAAMAQAGLHIPAEKNSALPVFDDILIDIGDEQSLEQSLSTFGGHIKRLRLILDKADAATLVLLDELGSGTDPDEGGAIGQAILDQLRQIGCRGMVTTHLSVLKAYAYNHDRVDNASVEFDTQTLRPTYKLMIGTPGESHAITVAKHLGMSRTLTDLARKYLGKKGQQFRRAIAATTSARESAEEARAQAQVAELAAVSQAEKLDSRMADLDRLQKEFTTWLARLGEMKPGDQLFVPAVRKIGSLVRLEYHKQKALVAVDGKQIEVPLVDLMPRLGQHDVRDEIAAMRTNIAQREKQAAEKLEEARALHAKASQDVETQKEKARQFDAWLGAISRMKIGDVVPIALKPGKGKLKEVDLKGLRVTIETKAGEKTISLQDIFPQTGPFARRPRKQRDAKGPDGRKRKTRKGAKDKPAKPDKNAPMQRRQRQSKAAKKNRKALENVQPGQEVYVVPFSKRATLIRIDSDKQQVVVGSGAFEMTLPIADVEPVGFSG